MKKNEMMSKIAAATGLRRVQAEKVADALWDALKEELLSQGKVYIYGFGTFKRVKRNERSFVHPKTRELVRIPARYKLIFLPSKRLTDAFAAERSNHEMD